LRETGANNGQRSDRTSFLPVLQMDPCATQQCRNINPTTTNEEDATNMRKETPALLLQKLHAQRSQWAGSSVVSNSVNDPQKHIII